MWTRSEGRGSFRKGHNMKQSTTLTFPTTRTPITPEALKAGGWVRAIDKPEWKRRIGDYSTEQCYLYLKRSGTKQKGYRYNLSFGLKWYTLSKDLHYIEELDFVITVLTEGWQFPEPTD